MKFLKLPLIISLPLIFSACTVSTTDIQSPDISKTLVVNSDYSLQTVDMKTSEKQNIKHTLDQAIALYHAHQYTRALPLFEHAKAGGHMKAPRYLGLMYLNGEGVKKDEKRAFSEFTLASNQGDITGQYWLGYLYEYGIGTKKDLNQAIYWYKKSATRGDHISQPAIDALKRLNQY